MKRVWNYEILKKHFTKLPRKPGRQLEEKFNEAPKNGPIGLGLQI